VRREAPQDGREVAVEQEHAAVDDEDALTECLDVGHGVAGEQHGGAKAPVVLRQERSDAALGDHVQAACGFVQEEDPRRVHQRHGELALHALAQRQLPRRLGQQRREIQQVHQVTARPPVGVFGHAVEDAVHLERGRDREVPVEPVAGTHH
jgi:hypothetical protein